jgi:hypothetical protein
MDVSEFVVAVPVLCAGSERPLLSLGPAAVVSGSVLLLAV